MEPRRFKKIYVEITSACNLSCPFCPPTRRPRSFMSDDQFRRVVSQAADYTGHIHLHVKGEPLLHPGLPGFLDQAHGLGLKVHLVTNGTLLAGRADLLLGHPAVRQINISLHSFAGPPGDVAGYLDPVLGFAHRAEQAGRPTVSLRFWTGPRAPLVQRVAGEFGWSVPEGLETGPARGFALGRVVYVNFDREFAWPDPDSPVRGTRGTCRGLRDQLAVLADGTVVPCCLDGEGTTALGNLFTQDLGAILDAPRTREILRGFSENRLVEDLCQRCGYRERFRF